MTEPIPFDPDFDAQAKGLTLGGVIDLLAPKSAFTLGLAASVALFMMLGFVVLLAIALKTKG